MDGIVATFKIRYFYSFAYRTFKNPMIEHTYKNISRKYTRYIFWIFSHLQKSFNRKKVPNY